MDAIKSGFWSDSEPINLIRDALNRAETTHTKGLRVKYLPRGCRCDSLTVAAPRRPSVTAACRRSGVRTRTPLGMGSHA